jgi:hypothetical protein
VQREVSHLPDPADMMFRVTKLQDVADLLMQELIN